MIGRAWRWLRWVASGRRTVWVGLSSLGAQQVRLVRQGGRWTNLEPVTWTDLPPQTLHDFTIHESETP